MNIKMSSTCSNKFKKFFYFFLKKIFTFKYTFFCTDL